MSSILPQIKPKSKIISWNPPPPGTSRATLGQFIVLRNQTLAKHRQPGRNHGIQIVPNRFVDGMLHGNTGQTAILRKPFQ